MPRSQSDETVARTMNAMMPQGRQGAAAAGPPAARPINLACHGLWKIYGRDAQAFMTRHGGRPTSADLAAAGMVGAVRDATLEVAEGEIFIIMGLSGSGKSTIVRCLSRLIEPTAGSVGFEGRDLLRLSERGLIEIR